MDTGNVWTTISGFPSRVEALAPDGAQRRRECGADFSLERLAQVASENPARIFGLYPRKGAIQIGPTPTSSSSTWTARPRYAPSAAHGYPLDGHIEGRRVQGWPVMTLLRGRGRHGMA